ncbi:putative arginyl-tRNA synthetase [Actinoplanes missouriensis 431]|uniref:Arginine--tRNA ligase n=1 Tax=Actinoplanes missouriensis (strain ATCC 14538 / DSM 43046 / CBS 188.64 / JCM 3121 / NBRC 102363 / NCIMB 12654 / NRRL B-3342 / UNCC 431) TaxID=512565 RepID=I0H0H2_ACTM4|nr:arginine--tRNA ligase [Actinoplanes missouriensis]BAL86509.1 putative arginyl-tRNA synthetase [Actinoplanes missouriensis 431]
MNLEPLLSDRLAPALEAVAGVWMDPAVRVSPHADFQSGAPLALARTLGRPPRDIAAEVAAKADLDGLAEIAVSGPGFLNLTVSDHFITEALDAMAGDRRLGVPLTGEPRRIVVDYSGPNVAKEMHVGHLRSTIIGDALARILQWQGHEVLRVNHLGDWGTPFGMLIEHLISEGAEGEHSLGDLTAFYRAARAEFEASEEFRTRARLRVVALQSGDPATRVLWRRLVERSEQAFLAVYDRLGVALGPDDFAGESSYQDALADVVSDLDRAGLLVESDGALCAFPAGFTGRDQTPTPLIVRKADGGFGYAATDLAALRHRVRDLGATELLYVVGSPQRAHFQMVFALARAAGWLPESVSAEHIGFGSVLGADGKMLKTRAGETIKLAALLDEAVARASAPEIGLAAIKYADLSGDRRGDYVFDVDRMLASTGNTGPYLQYAYARVRSLFARSDTVPGPVLLDHPAERALGLALLGWEPAVRSAAELREPHRLASYLHDLAATFSSFYERCPVLRAEPAVRASRLTLADLVAHTLHIGMFLLGIPVLEEI